MVITGLLLRITLCRSPTHISFKLYALCTHQLPISYASVASLAAEGAAWSLDAPRRLSSDRQLGNLIPE